LKCPRCHGIEDRVLDSRLVRDGKAIRRRRECLKCGHRFTTYEWVEETMPLVVKKDGRREPYSREKILAGVRKAFEKRPVSVQEQEELVDEVERFLLSIGEKEVSSQLIGEEVMNLIKGLDQVAYVRFASVYRQFRDLSDFIEELKTLMEAPAPRPSKKEEKVKKPKSLATSKKASSPGEADYPRLPLEEDSPSEGK
jgi:transcriptional repressor NrdR